MPVLQPEFTIFWHVARVLPLRLGREAIALGIPVADHVVPIGIRTHRVAGLEPRRVREQVAEPNGLLPGDFGHRRPRPR